MKKLFKVSISNESFIVAENEQEAIEKYWEGINNGEGIDVFMDNLATTKEIEDTDGILEELFEELKE
tara:strand:+ start:740 stop:940 length:201 start_codon:yes stop_codon:yes gene_type:complete